MKRSCSRPVPRFLLRAAFLLLPACAGAARDYPEALESYGAASDGSGPLPSYYAAFQHDRHAFLHDAYDGFFFRTNLVPALWRDERGFGLALRFGSVLMCGPVPEGETARSIVAFWMNAVQFEYGLDVALPLPGGGSCTLEYARTSQHPLVAGFSQVATDQVNLLLPLTRRAGGEAGKSAVGVEGILRAGYVDLFGFWDSPIPKPKTLFVIAPMLRAAAGGWYLRLNPEFLLLRDGGPAPFALDLQAEAGRAFVRGPRRLELYLEWYSSEDSEILRDRKHRAREAGLGIRLSTD